MPCGAECSDGKWSRESLDRMERAGTPERVTEESRRGEGAVGACWCLSTTTIKADIHTGLGTYGQVRCWFWLQSKERREEHRLSRSRGINVCMYVTFTKTLVTTMFSFLICTKGTIQDALSPVVAVGKKNIHSNYRWMLTMIRICQGTDRSCSNVSEITFHQQNSFYCILYHKPPFTFNMHRYSNLFQSKA